MSHKLISTVPKVDDPKTRGEKAASFAPAFCRLHSDIAVLEFMQAVREPLERISDVTRGIAYNNGVLAEESRRHPAFNAFVRRGMRLSAKYKPVSDSMKLTLDSGLIMEESGDGRFSSTDVLDITDKELGAPLETTAVQRAIAGLIENGLVEVDGSFDSTGKKPRRGFRLTEAGRKLAIHTIFADYERHAARKQAS